MERYTSIHRSVLNYFMLKIVVLVSDAICALRRIYECDDNYDGPQHSLEQIVKTINSVIRDHNFEIRLGTCEVTHKDYYAVVCRKEDPICKDMQYYSDAERAFLKKIWDEIFVSSEHGFVSTSTCINFNTEISYSMTKTEADNILQKFGKDGWLVIKDDMVYLGVRTYLEMEPFLKAEYVDCLEYCDMCKAITVIGYHCPGCEKVYHNLCIHNYFRTTKTDPCCPSCSTMWPGIEIPEQAPAEDQNEVASGYDTPGPSTQQRSSSRGSRLRDLDIMDVDALQEHQSTRRSSARH